MSPAMRLPSLSLEPRCVGGCPEGHAAMERAAPAVGGIAAPAVGGIVLPLLQNAPMLVFLEGDMLINSDPNMAPEGKAPMSPIMKLVPDAGGC